jgi:hypothetical protein
VRGGHPVPPSLVALLLLCGAAGAAEEVDGTQPTLRFERRHLFVGPHENATVADLDLDGHLDIVWGPYWFAGPDLVPRSYRANHASSDYHRNNSDHVLDVDGDGWPDVVSGGWGEDGVFWYRNPGDHAERIGEPWRVNDPWEEHRLATTRGHMEMFALHDYDGDGRPELHSACYRKHEPLEVWRFGEDDGGRPVLTPFVLGAQGGGHGFAFGDVDGDGREDVLTEIGWYRRPPGDPFAGPWSFHPETALPHPSCPFVVSDINGDGRLDVVFGRGHDVGLYWWEQQDPAEDGTTRWKPHVIDESWSQAHALALADLDGDGREELIAGKCIWAHEGDDPGAGDPPAVYYYEWDGEAFRRHTIAAPGDGIALGRQFEVADLDGDGRPDLVAPSELGLWVFFNRGRE